MISSYLSKKRLILLAISILLGTVVFTALSCDRFTLLRVENQSHSDVTIFVNKDLQGSVNAKEHETFNTSSIPNRPDAPDAPVSGKYLIEAKTREGVLVYSKEFTWQELRDLKWTIVIPPKT